MPKRANRWKDNSWRNALYVEANLTARDLFNRDTRYHSYVTATTCTEGGSSFLHHDVSLTFNYKFDAKKKYEL